MNCAVYLQSNQKDEDKLILYVVIFSCKNFQSFKDFEHDVYCTIWNNIERIVYRRDTGTYMRTIGMAERTTESRLSYVPWRNGLFQG